MPTHLGGGEPIFASPSVPSTIHGWSGIDERSIQIEDDSLEDLFGQSAQTHRNTPSL
jgi:hypothetical protein